MPAHPIPALVILRALLTCVVLAALLWAAPAAAQGAGRAAAEGPLVDVASEDLADLLETLRDPAARGALIRHIETLTALEEQPDAAAAGGLPLARLSERLGEFAGGLATLGRNLGSPGRILTWLGDQASDPERRGFWSEAFVQLAIVLAAALILWQAARAVLRKPRTYVEAREAPTLWVRIPLLAVRTALDLVPLGAFAGAAYGALALTDPAEGTRVVLLAAANAVVLAQGLIAVARAGLTPLAPNLRLWPLADRTAAYLFVWVRRVVVVSVYGFMIAQAAFLLGLPEGGFAVLTKLVGLISFAMVFVFVLQNRAPMQAWLAQDEPGRSSTIAVIRNRFADIWHILAGLYLIAAYLVWALELGGGFTFIARGTAQTIAIFFAAWAAIAIVRQGAARAFRVNNDIRERFPALETRANRYVLVLRRTLEAIVYGLAALTILQAWSLDVFSLFGTDLGRTILARAFSILVIVLISLFVWEFASAGIDRLLSATNKDGSGVLQSARARTLLPLARSALLIVIAVTATLAGLSELGVNIAPLLAGAGVVGLAVGFGAQTLVKDIITGAFILFEDTIAVGDFISVGGSSGTVEALTVRTIRLRDYHGTVHTIPFSAVDSVTNMTKDFAYFVTEVGVAYRENTDDVVVALREVGGALAADPEFSGAILEPIDIAGVDRFDDSAVIIRARIKVQAGQQWRIKREFNRRLKYKFDEAGIEIPFPHTTVFFGEDRDGKAPSAKLQIEGWPDRTG